MELDFKYLYQKWETQLLEGKFLEFKISRARA